MAIKKKPAAKKTGKVSQDPPKGDEPKLFKAVRTTKRVNLSGPQVPPKTRRGVTKSQAKPKRARARVTGENKRSMWERADGIPASKRKKPRATPEQRQRLQDMQPMQPQRTQTWVVERDIPDRGYNYTDGSYTGMTPYERAGELDRAMMNARAAGERRRRGEVIIPEEFPVYPRPEAPKQWAVAPRVRKATIRRKV